MKTILILAFSIFTIIGQSQIPEIIRQKCDGTSFDDYNPCIIEDGPDYLMGFSRPSNKQYFDSTKTDFSIWLVEIDSMGNFIWDKFYGGSDFDKPEKIIRTTDNGYYLLGLTFSNDGDVQSFNHGDGDLWVVRLDQNKNILWEKCFGTPYYEEPRDIILTPDGGVVVIGQIHGAGGDVSVYYGYYDIWMFKLDPTGNLEWEKTIGNEEEDKGFSIMLNSLNNIMLIGATTKNGGLVDCYLNEGWPDVWLVELDLQGNILAQNCYGGSYYDLGIDLLEIDDGFILLCYTDSNDGDVSGLHGTPNGSSDIWILKIDGQFNIVWQKCLGGYSSESPDYILKTEDAGYMIFGSTSSHDGDVAGNHSSSFGNDSDVWVVKINQSGEIEWQQCYGGWGSEWMWNKNCVLKKDDYDFIITSSTDFGPSYDVLCSPGYLDRDSWIFEIKDCDIYTPSTPETPAGDDTVCNSLGSTSFMSIHKAQNADTYEWRILPANSGSLTQTDTSAVISWNPSFEGTSSVIVRSNNECGTSQWSEPHHVIVVNCIGIAEQQAGDIRLKVYPNPAREFVVFELNKASRTGTIVIYNSTGTETARLQTTGNRTTWHTVNIKPGLFFYRVETEEKVLSGKIVIHGG